MPKDLFDVISIIILRGNVYYIHVYDIMNRIDKDQIVGRGVSPGGTKILTG